MIKMPNPKPTAYGYARASGASQETSVPNQIQAIERHYEEHLKNDYTWGGVFQDDGVSAFKKPFDERPEGKRLWVALKPFDALIYTRHDRLIRSMVDGAKIYEKLQAKNINAISLADGKVGLEGTGAAIGFAFWSLIGQATSSLTRDRTIEAKQELMLRGERHSKTCPAGYTFKKTGTFRANGKRRVLVIPNAEERQYVRDCLIKYINGESLNSIEARTHRNGILKADGTMWWTNKFNYAFHSLVLEWPSTYCLKQHEWYWKTLYELDLMEGNYRENLLTSLERCQQMIRDGVDLSVRRRGYPLVMTSIYSSKRAAGVGHFPKNA